MWAIDCSNAFRLEGIWETTSGEEGIPIPPILLEHATPEQKAAYKAAHEAYLIKMAVWTKNNYRAKALLMLSTGEGPRTHILGLEKASDM